MNCRADNDNYITGFTVATIFTLTQLTLIQLRIGNVYEEISMSYHKLKRFDIDSRKTD